MKSKKIKIGIFLSALMCINSLQAQVLETKLIKQVRVTIGGYTDTVDLAPIIVTNSGNVVVSGNEKVSATQYNVETAHQLSNGVISWSQSFNTSTNKAWTTASCHDASDNIIVVGAIRSGTATGLDYLIVKYNSSGVQQWSKVYNGPNSTTDVASAVTTDPSGNIYVTGASEGTATAVMDIATLKYNSAGTLQWTHRYNYANSIDVGTGISVVPGNLVVVSGSSGSSFTNYDFVTIKLKAANGATTAIARSTNTAAAAQDQVSSMATDASGKVYVAGTMKNGSNYDAQLTKLDTSLNVLWTKTFNGHGYDDAGVSVALDSNLNVYMTGVSHINSTTTEMFVVKYDKLGNLKWKFQNPSHNGSPNAEGIRVKVKSKNEIFIGGTYGKNSGQDLVLLCLDSLGRIQIHKTYNGPTGLKDKFLDMALADSNVIYVSARTYSAGFDYNTTIKYQYTTITQATSTLSGGVKYVGKELIVKFDKKALRTDTINNVEIPFGILSDFVHDTTVTKISSLLSAGGGLVRAGEFPTRKIFFDLKTTDSLSLSRTGNNIKVPQFYCYLLISLPSSLNTASTRTALETIMPDIKTAELNFILQPCSESKSSSVLAANDPYYNNYQGALHNVPLYSNVNINCDSAWTFTSGQPSIKVGVYDTGVDFAHNDFASNTGGWNFFTNAPTTNYDDFDHGTPVAGIIGASRNNNIGIAGIAGGDASTSQQGVSLYDCRVVNNQVCPHNVLANAIQKGANGTVGFALNVMNLSIALQGSYINTVTAAAHVVVDAMNFANRNGVAIVAAKANSNIGTFTFPADYSDETTMSVGSSGTDGHHAVIGLNSSQESRTWGYIDFLAPGTDSLVKSLDNNGNNEIHKFDGTSMASPMVAGASALLMSYVNTVTPTWDNLVNEDCENLLQKTCVDLVSTTYNEKPGYDTVSGWGRINVARALQKIKKNFYKIRHVDETHFATSFTRNATIVHSGVVMNWPNYNSVPAGSYTTNVYELTTTLTYSLPPNETILGFWPLSKESYGATDTTEIVTDRPYYCKIISVSPTTAVLKTYYYHNTNFPFSYSPYSAAACKSAFSLYTYDASGTIGVKENEISSTNFVLFPNPNNGEYEVRFNSTDNSSLTYKISNIVGQEVKMGTYKAQYGDNNIKINMSNLTNGVYILNIFDNTGLVYKQKVIKQ